MSIKIKKLDPDLPTPCRYRQHDRGLDLYARTAVLIEPHTTAIVPTGIAIELPIGYEAQVRGRSGLALAGVWCHFGTVDNGYTGEIMVILHNTNGEPFHIDRGDRITQLVVQREHALPVEVVEELSATERGSSGIGSSGK